jgi:hypothetical protein
VNGHCGDGTVHDCQRSTLSCPLRFEMTTCARDSLVDDEA